MRCPVCRGLGITGLCCPTPEGVLLGCCDSQQTSNSSVTAHMQDEWRGLLYCDLAGTQRLSNLCAVFKTKSLQYN
jgi:hypothetical protein